LEAVVPLLDDLLYPINFPPRWGRRVVVVHSLNFLDELAHFGLQTRVGLHVLDCSCELDVLFHRCHRLVLLLVVGGLQLADYNLIISSSDLHFLELLVQLQNGFSLALVLLLILAKCLFLILLHPLQVLQPLLDGQVLLLCARQLVLGLKEF